MVIILTDANMKDAVNAWCNGDTTTYGHISTWDTSNVTNMSKLFMDAENFNIKVFSYINYNNNDLFYRNE